MDVLFDFWLIFLHHLPKGKNENISIIKFTMEGIKRNENVSIYQ